MGIISSYGWRWSSATLLPVALGMNFLHSKQTVHRDIKAANVVGAWSSRVVWCQNCRFWCVSSHWEPQCCWMCRDRSVMNTWDFIRDEVTDEKLKKSDVYAANFPFEGNVVDAPNRPFRGHVCREDVLLGCMPKFPAVLNRDLLQLISDCWHAYPVERPYFAATCELLGSTPLCNLVVPRHRAVALFEFLWEAFLYLVRWL